MNPKHPYAGLADALDTLGIAKKQINFVVNDETLPWLLGARVPTNPELSGIDGINGELLTNLSTQLSRAGRLHCGRTINGELVYYTAALPDEIDEAAFSYSSVAIGGIPYTPMHSVADMGVTAHRQKYSTRTLYTRTTATTSPQELRNMLFPGLPGLTDSKPDINLLPPTAPMAPELIPTELSGETNYMVEYIEDVVGPSFRRWANHPLVSAWVEHCRLHYGQGKIRIHVGPTQQIATIFPLTFAGYWAPFNLYQEGTKKHTAPRSNHDVITSIDFTPYPPDLAPEHRVVMTVEVRVRLNSLVTGVQGVAVSSESQHFSYTARYCAGPTPTECFQGPRRRYPVWNIAVPVGVACFCPASLAATIEVLGPDIEDDTWLPDPTALSINSVRTAVTLAEESVGLPAFVDTYALDWYVLAAPHPASRIYVLAKGDVIASKGHSWALDELEDELFVRSETYTAVFNADETAALLTAQINASELSEEAKQTQRDQLENMRHEETHSISTVVVALNAGWAPKADVHKDMGAYALAVYPGTSVDLFNTPFDTDETWKTVINRADGRRKRGRMLGFAAFTTDDGTLLSDMDDAIVGAPVEWLLEAAQAPQAATIVFKRTYVNLACPVAVISHDFTLLTTAEVAALWRDICRLVSSGAAYSVEGVTDFFSYLLLDDTDRTPDRMAALRAAVTEIGIKRLIAEQAHPLTCARYPWDFTSEQLAGTSSLLLIGERADEAFTNFWLSGMNAIFGIPVRLATEDGPGDLSTPVRVGDVRL